MMMNQRPPPLTSRVEISMSCRNLLDRDVTSKSDPMVALFQLNVSTQRYIEIGRSDMIKNSHNPDFAKTFELDYHFEQSQKLRFEVYDVDSRSQHLGAHDFLGRVDCTLGELVSRGRYELKLQGVSGIGRIILKCMEMVACKEVLNIQLMGEHLDNKDFLGKSDPFLEIFRPISPDLMPGTQYIAVHRTEYVKNNLNPMWKQFHIRLAKLCYGNKSLPLRFDCYDYDSDGSHDVIGSFTASVEQLLSSSQPGVQNAFPLINSEKKQKKKNYKDSGIVRVKSISVEAENTFVDFISGGTELHFTVAIDFTASNRNPTQPSSLHHIQRGANLNQYESAIVSVGEIIQDYDSDRQFPGLGFGARIPPNDDVSHCFPLSFNPQNPFCAGVSGLLEAYRQALRALNLYGPTNFSPVIRHLMEFAKTHQDGSKYFVLLIITDGIITDIEATIRAIIEASNLPMSIIIIGVGNEDFSAMEVLDSDRQRLRLGNSVAARDIIQFVPLRDFFSSRSSAMGQAALAQAVLAELPDQLVLWMRSRRIAPLPRAPHQYAGTGAGAYPGPGMPPPMPAGGTYAGMPPPTYPGPRSATPPPPYPGAGGDAYPWAPPYPGGGGYAGP